MVCNILKGQPSYKAGKKKKKSRINLPLQEKCMGLLSHQPAQLLLSGSLRSSEAGQKTQEKPSPAKLVLKSNVLKGHRQGCHSSWIAWQSHFQAYQIMFHLPEYSCASTQTQPPAPKPDSFPQHKGLNCAFQQVLLLPLYPSFSWDGLLLLHSNSTVNCGVTIS